MDGLRITEAKGGMDLAMQVVPRASRNEIVRVHGDALKVRLTAPPVEGKANGVLIVFNLPGQTEALGHIRASLHGQSWPSQAP
jgi:hypothetical protein